MRAQPYSRFSSYVAAVLFVTVALLAPSVAQTYTVLHTFTGADGENPTAGVVIDQAGNLYGTASEGGDTSGDCANFLGCGTVYKLSYKNSVWIFNLLYTFNGSDGLQPLGRVVFGPDGRLYGTTTFGGAFGNGTVFSLQPRATPCPTVSCHWNETVLYSFTGGADGSNPGYGDLAFDRAGNIYGTTTYGGTQNMGAIFELSSSHGVWTERVLHSFGATPGDGQYPYAGVVLDGAGNLYGTTILGGTFGGTVYELQQGGGGWSETILHDFQEQDDGYQAIGGLIFDSSGNLYGASSVGGAHGGGAVYELTPSGGSWTFRLLYSLTAYQGTLASLSMDSSGQLYGTLFAGPQEIFRLTESDGQWMQTGFSGGVGGEPYGNVTLDSTGNLYTTSDNLVFEMTP
jgi:uncharacterized repeat protein (TIGR03803 family)